MSSAIQDFIAGLPKAELHLHIEGTLEPEMVFRLAARNRIKLPYATVEDMRAAYAFTDLQDFLNLYYQATQVLVHEQDFYDLASAYLARARATRLPNSRASFKKRARWVCARSRMPAKKGPPPMCATRSTF